MHMFLSDAPRLAKLLPLLTSLDTLEVVMGDCKDSEYGCFFTSTKLPQIRTLVIHEPVHFLIKCCTHVERITIYLGALNNYLKSIAFVGGPLVYLALYYPTLEIV